MQQIQQFYDFPPFRLDVKNRSLMNENRVVPLTPKEFEVLLLLVENAGQVVEKDFLLSEIWKDTFVEEGTLTRNISWLRKKLAANGANETKIIETLPKRGYRFLPEVSKTREIPQIVEEQIISHIEIEESIEIRPSNFEESEFLYRASQPEIIPNVERKALPAAPKNRSSLLMFGVFGIAILLVLAFAAFQYESSKNNQPILSATKVVPFSGLPGREISPAFSPDGKQLVYAWDGGIEENNLDIYIKLIGAGEPVRLTDSPTDEINPVFSPDGKSIAFIRNFPDHNEIILIPALGGAERKISEKASYASLSFSPDGKFLAHADLDLTSNENGIFLINLETNEKTRLTAPEHQIVDHTPRFSTDGKSLAFIRHFSSLHREIFVVPASGGEPRQITFDNVRIYGLAWENDNQNLLFTSYRTNNRLNVWRVSVGGDEPQMISTGRKSLQSVAVSPDGQTIAAVEETADENIWEIENSAKRPLIRSISADHSQQFSPDGTKIVFASERTGNYEIWIADADGKNQRQLTGSGNSSGSPRFSPDGKFIAFDTQTADQTDVYIVSIDGGAPRKLTDTGKNSLPAWSADGKNVFFISDRSGENQIWKMPVDGGESIQITREGAFEMFAAPDGKTLVYSKTGKSGLRQIGVNGGNETAIANLSEAAAWRSWTVTEKGIYYAAFAIQPPLKIRFYDFATAQTRDVVSAGKMPLAYYSNLAVSPDGKRILYAQQDQINASIILIENKK